MTGIVKILSLLPILYKEYEEVKLITQLNDFFKFDHNIYLLDSSTDKNHFMYGDNTPKTFYIFNVSDNITGLEKLREIKSKTTFAIVVPGSAKYYENLKLLTKLKEIQRLQKDMKIGIFFMYSPSEEDIKNMFNWCKKNLIANIFATYIQGPSDERPLNIFTLNPFGPIDVINVTGVNETFTRFFPSLKSNFQQHELVFLDAPQSQHSDGFVWQHVIRRMNATWRLVTRTFTRTSKLFESGIDVIPQKYVIQDATQISLYPLRIEPQVIIVPEALQYPDFSAYLLTVTSDQFFGYSLFTIIVVMILLCIIRYVEQKQMLIFQSVGDVLNLLMNDNGYIKYQRLSRVEIFLIVPLTFVGLIIENGILSNLQSYLTRPVIQPQINTAEELYRSAIKIVTHDEAMKTILNNVLTNLSAHKDWADKISVQELDALAVQVNKFNRSISTSVLLNDVKVLLAVQKALNIKGYHVPKIRISFSFHTHYVNDKFLFFERLNEIIDRMRSAGLYDLWRRYDRTVLANKLEKINSKSFKNNDGSDVESEVLPIPKFIVHGWIASAIVLIIEIIWKKLNFTCIKRFKRIFAKKVADRTQKKIRKVHYRRQQSTVSARSKIGYNS